MLILPVTGRQKKKKIPIITLGLIVVNIFIYFFIQVNDTESYRESISYYQKSGLAKIELSAYKTYLEKKQGKSSLTKRSAPKNESHLIGKLLADHQFISLLRANRIIRPHSPVFSQWREKRDFFEALQAKIISKRFGYSPTKNEVLTLVTYMFLHGSVMHLVGNMVFLYFVGSLLEIVVGPSLFTAGYLLTGMFSGYLFGLIYPLNPGPLIGASGAIAGLMGGYSVLFRLRKIRVFYSLGFYFNYAKVPAIILLPLWLANEFYQLYSQPGSRVAYVAHIGGLVSGGLLAGCHLLFKKDVVSQLFEEDEQQDTITTFLENGLKKLAKLDMAGARKDFLAVLALQPNHRKALRHLFNIDKSNPQSDQFHKTSNQLLGSLGRSEDTLFLETYETYKELSIRPRLSEKTILNLIRIYFSRHDTVQTERHLSVLIKKKSRHPQIPVYLLKLAELYKREGQKKRALTCLAILAKRFGNSNEGIQAKKILGHLEKLVF